ncbi:insulinase family protein [Flammeovirgaceae bacterium SG7u.111]|nr:insulinase family protein [Flammeovirgaceae bacterium SG7u.132]WPO35355.1 insulinase family protein [Flammeovirgaceae bacterium SG7u.111]
MYQRIIVFFFGIMFVVGQSLFAQSTLNADAAISNINNEIPVDPSIRIGKLDNGMTYYIKKNAKPENKVDLRLAVNAGSILEDDDQLGLAHFMEHMCFNGTKNFEKNELVSYLQSIGVKFGAHLNAYTSFDETVYILPIPVDDEDKLNKGLQILEDWAFNASLDPEEIEKERGVVIEEWRLGLGADGRMREVWLPVLLKDSRYAERLPIGTKEVLESFKPETIQRFYKDWYRPDLMAVVAVGDIDVDEMEKKIKEQFGKVPAVKKPKKRIEYDMPQHEETLVAIAKDKEATYNRISIYYKHQKESFKTIADYRQQVMNSLYNGMLNQRLNELRQSATPPFMYGGASYGGFLAGIDAYTVTAIAGDNGILTGMESALEESYRVLQHGFTPGELERYKTELLAYMERAYNERDKSESGNYADEYVRNFLEDEPIPGIATEFAIYKEFLPTIKLEEVNALAKKWMTPNNRVVVVTAVEKEGNEVPTKAQITGLLEKVDKKKLEPYVDEVSATALMEELPAAGKIVDEEKKALGVTELTLSNGVKVVLKPTDFKNDEILLDGYSWGGSSLYPDEDYQSVTNADAIMSQSGLKDMNNIALQKLMTGKIASASPYIRQLTQGISGSAAPKDLETMFQLVHLNFTAPRKDPEAFQSYINQNKALYKNLLSNPQYYFMDQASKVMSQNSIRGGGFPTEEDWNNIDLDRSFEIYQERFADASGFTFFLVGNFKVEEIKPLLATYLGSLPALNKDEKWKDLNIRYPEGKVEKIVKKGTEPKSMVRLAVTGYFDYDKKTAYKMTSVAQVLTIKLIERLREEIGGVYGVGASASVQELPVGSYMLNISFPCGPDNVEKLTEAALDELKKLREEGPSEEDLVKIKETQKLEMKENLKQNRFWLSTLRNSYMYDRDYTEIEDYEERIDKLTAEDLKKVAAKYFTLDNYAKMVLIPE